MEKLKFENRDGDPELERGKIANMLRDLEVTSKSSGSLPDYGFENVSPEAKENLLAEVGAYELSNGYKIEVFATDDSTESARLLDKNGNTILNESIQIYLSSNYNKGEAEKLIKELEEEDPNELDQLYFNEDGRLNWIRYKKGDMMLIERVGRMMNEKLALENYKNLLEKKHNKGKVDRQEYEETVVNLLKNTTNIDKAVEIINEQRTGEHDLIPKSLSHLSDEVRGAFSESIEDNLGWIDLKNKDNPETKKHMKEIFDKVVSKDYSQVLTDRVGQRLLVLMRSYLKFE